TLNTPQIYEYLDYLRERANEAKGYIVGQYESHFQKPKEPAHVEPHKIVATSPRIMDVTLKKDYVCQIHSQQHINICALEEGFLEKIAVREGQAVKKDYVMFKIVPTLYQARLDAEMAEARLAELEFKNTKQLFENNAVVSKNEVLLFEA